MMKIQRDTSGRMGEAILRLIQFNNLAIMKYIYMLLGVQNL